MCGDDRFGRTGSRGERLGRDRRIGSDDDPVTLKRLRLRTTFVRRSSPCQSPFGDRGCDGWGRSSAELGTIPLIAPDTLLELVDVRLLDYGHVTRPAGDHEDSLLVDPMDIGRGTGARFVDVGRATREGDDPLPSWMHDRQPRSCEPIIRRYSLARVEPRAHQHQPDASVTQDTHVWEPQVASPTRRTNSIANCGADRQIRRRRPTRHPHKLS